MTASSTTPADTARKGVQAVLRVMQEPGRAVSIASAMGVSEATVSRLKNEQLDQLALFLAHAGLKIVLADRICVDRETYTALTHIATKAMANPAMARELVWDDE